MVVAIFAFKGMVVNTVFFRELFVKSRDWMIRDLASEIHNLTLK